MRAAFSLNPWESKRLIGRAVARMPVVQHALSHKQILIAHGSTNIFVADEIMGACPDREQYVSGQVINATLCQTEPVEKPPILRLVKGKPAAPLPTMDETLAGWDDECVFIKGANAVDPDFNAGIFNAHPAGGTIGFAYGTISAIGIPLIIPVGLEKLVPSITAAAAELGHAKVDYFSGIKIGMIPIPGAIVVTEIQAFDILFGLAAVHVGAGGVAGSEGTQVLVVKGAEAAVKAAIAEVEGIKGEEPVALEKAWCATCKPTTPGLLADRDEQFAGHTGKQCIYEGLSEDQLPDWFSSRR